MLKFKDGKKGRKKKRQFHFAFRSLNQLMSNDNTKNLVSEMENVQWQ